MTNVSSDIRSFGSALRPVSGSWSSVWFVCLPSGFSTPSPRAVCATILEKGVPRTSLCGSRHNTAFALLIADSFLAARGELRVAPFKALIFYSFDLFFRHKLGYANGGQKYCKYCGTANATSTSFCTECGKTFTSASASPQPPPSPVKEKKIPCGFEYLRSARVLLSAPVRRRLRARGELGWTTFIAFLAR